MPVLMVKDETPTAKDAGRVNEQHVAVPSVEFRAVPKWRSGGRGHCCRS